MEVDELTTLQDFADFVKEEQQKEPRSPENRIQLECLFEARLAESLKEANTIWDDLKNKTAGPAGSGPAVRSSESDEVECQIGLTTSINDKCCQEDSSERLALRDDSPACYINKKVWNQRNLTITERCCVGLLNSLMENDKRYAWVRNEQLAHWLGLTPDSVDNMLRRLRTGGYIADIGKHRGVHRWIVCAAWRNPPKKRAIRPPF